LRVLGSILRLKAETDSSSRGQKDFICREEKRKAAWGHAGGSGNRWSCVLGWRLGFIAFLYFPRVEMSLKCKQMFYGKKCFFWAIISFWDLLKSVLQVPPLK
jgi:hypothetical protein